MNLIKLTRLELAYQGEVQARTDVWVNPRFVTSIQPASTTKPWSLLWVVGESGYGTFKIIVEGTPNEIATLLNK